MIATLLAALVLGAPALAEDAPSLPDMAVSKSTPGWSRQGRSLVLYDADGSLSTEVGLTREDAGSTSREVVGEPSPDGRAAWTVERKLTYNPPRTKLLESRRALRVYGSSGQTLWTNDAVDWPEKGDPVLFSADSKVIFVAVRTGEAWAVEARDWAGNVRYSAGGFPKLISIGLAPGGRYAWARWGVPDKSDTHAFFDLWTKTRKDVETSELTLGLARVGDDGVVRSGRRAVFTFTPSTGTAAGAGAGAGAGPDAGGEEPK